MSLREARTDGDGIKVGTLLLVNSGHIFTSLMAHKSSDRLVVRHVRMDSWLNPCF